MKLFMLLAAYLALYAQQSWATNGISLSGNISYSCDSAYCVLTAGRISNDGTVYSKTGTLRLELWALPAPYSGSGSIQGNQMAFYSLGQLSANYSFNNVSSGSVAKTVNSPSNCYAVMLLTMYNNGYSVVDYANMSQRLSNCSTTTSTSSGATTGSTSNTSTSSNAAYDFLFNWIEANYSSYFAPRGMTTRTSAPFSYRYYPTTNSYVGASSNDNSLYYLGPATGNRLTHLGSTSEWLKISGYSGSTGSQSCNSSDYQLTSSDTLTSGLAKKRAWCACGFGSSSSPVAGVVREYQDSSSYYIGCRPADSQWESWGCHYDFQYGRWGCGAS